MTTAATATGRFAIDPPPDSSLDAYAAWAAGLRRRRDFGIAERHRLSGEFPSSERLDQIEEISREVDTIGSVLEFSDVKTLPTLRVKALQAELAEAEAALDPALDQRLAALEAWTVTEASWKLAIATFEFGRGSALDRDKAHQSLSAIQTTLRLAEAHHEGILERIRARKRDLAEAMAPPPRPNPVELSDVAIRLLFAEAGVYVTGGRDVPIPFPVRVWDTTRFVVAGDGAALLQLERFARVSARNNERCRLALAERPAAEFETVGAGYRIVAATAKARFG